MARTDLRDGDLFAASLGSAVAGGSLGRGHLALATAGLTLATFTAAEVVTVYTDPISGVALHALTLSALFVASGFGRQGGGPAEHPLGRLLLALALVPLIRIVSLTMPLGRFDETFWFAAAGLPVFVGAVVVGASLGLRPGDIGLRFVGAGLPVQFWVVVLGLALGVGEYHILRPDPLIDELTLSQFVVPALVLLVATGFLEEFVFRGVLQRTAAAAMGAPAVLYVSLIFAILHIGYRSGTDVMFVFVIALLYGWVVWRTGSIIGVSLSHGITNITLFLLVPFIPVLSARPDWLPPLP